MPDRKRYNVFLDNAQLEGLRRVRERDGILPAEQVRRAVDQWLEQKGVKKAERKRGATRARS